MMVRGWTMTLSEPARRFPASRTAERIAITFARNDNGLVFAGLIVGYAMTPVIFLFCEDGAGSGLGLGNRDERLDMCARCLTPKLTHT